jgi:triosephosphate isomerase
VLVCPPFTSLQFAAKMLEGSHIAVGGQDLSEHETGAYTGEISADMLLTAGATHVILGHSERRQYHQETDNAVGSKAKLALGKGLVPIVCVGEELSQRESGQTEEVVGAQVHGCLSGIDSDSLRRVVVAYEPVWAIGTGKTATPDMAQEVHAYIRDQLVGLTKNDSIASQIPILYGGSVKPNNAADLLTQADIDGALVGGASLKADDFMAIINAA